MKESKLLIFVCVIISDLCLFQDVVLLNLFSKIWYYGLLTKWKPKHEA